MYCGLTCLPAPSATRAAPSVAPAGTPSGSGCSRPTREPALLSVSLPPIPFRLINLWLIEQAPRHLGQNINHQWLSPKNMAWQTQHAAGWRVYHHLLGGSCVNFLRNSSQRFRGELPTLRVITCLIGAPPQPTLKHLNWEGQPIKRFQVLTVCLTFRPRLSLDVL